MADYQQAAYLLHSRPYREHQQIVDLLTEQDGKVSAVVYVGQSLKNSKKALLQPFLPISVSLKGQQALKKLTLVECQHKSFTLQGNYLFSGFYINELLVRLLPELIPSTSLFSDYQTLIENLSKQLALEPLLRHFELRLLEELGVALDFGQVSLLDGQYVSFCTERGFVVSEANLISYSKQDLLAIAKQDYSSTEIMQTFKRLMRQVFDHLLGYKPLNSRRLFVKREPQ